MENITFPNGAVCIPDGKPITIPTWNHGATRHVVDLVRDFLDYNLEVHRHGDNDYLVPPNALCQKLLTIPERAIIEAFAWYCREYTTGYKRDQSFTFPKLIHSYSDAAIVNTEEPLSFGDEGRAYMFADVVEYSFGFEAQVIDLPAGWRVVVSGEGGLDADTVTPLQGVCRALMSYTVTSAEPAFASNISACSYHTPSPESRQACHDRQNAPLERIESAIGEILSRLDQIAATGQEVPSTATDETDLAQSVATGGELLANMEEHASRKGGRHSPPSSGKSTKRKRSA